MTIGNAREESLFKLIAEGGDAAGVSFERQTCELGGPAEPDNAGNIFRAGAEAALMMAAEEKLAKTRAALDEQRSDSLRA